MGEIALRSAASFTEYWKNPQATKAVFDDDRWYHTGDFGKIQGGCLYLEGRRQDLIIRGGENISPVEIENRLFEHPGIAEAVVVGVDHPTLGQEVKAFVVPKVPGELSEADVENWCSEVLAPFKVPAYVEFVAELPHNAVGKVVKGLLGQSPTVATFIEE